MEEHPHPDRPAAPSDWSRIKAIFLEAVEKPAAEQAAYLDDVCADDRALRLEIESLLASDRQAGSFGETPASAMMAEDETPESQPTRLAPGTWLGGYEITGFVAAGGMGEIYRARDTRLGREVAVKTLPATEAEAGAGRRLLKEARHASLLSHPNICTIHEVGEDSGRPFIVMEYIHGRSLKVLREEGAISPREAVAYGGEIADALAHAHRRGIVHRDLKSSNIVIDADGRAIVLDFGLARRLPGAAGASADSTVTLQHAVAGTLSYMAPELLLGGEADARSDIWSFGVLLYELASGSLPFDGRTSFETTSAIIGEPPRPLPRRVPLTLRLVISRCLAKEPGARYQRAEEVRDALDAVKRHRSWRVASRLLFPSRRAVLGLAAAAVAVIATVVLAGNRLLEVVSRFAAPRVTTIAVLPLGNATGDPKDQYFADGITDAIITQIGSLGTLRVISRTSSERAAAAGKSIPETAAALGAGALVQGTLHRSGDTIRLTMRLIDAGRGGALWSDEYERPVRDILILQAEVVRALAVTIQGTLEPQARDRLAMVRTVHPQAYEEYLKGRYEWHRRTQESLLRAVSHLTRARELDPTYAPAYAALADCYNQLGTVLVGSGSPRRYRPLAAAEAMKALQLDPLSAEAHATLAYTYHYDWKWKEAEREFLRAIELNPSYALARVWYANLLMSLNRMDDALREIYTARDLDPYSLVTNTNVGWVLQVARREEDAIAQLEQTLTLDPDYPQAHMRLSGSLRNVGEFDAAIEHARRVIGLTQRSPSALAVLGEAYAKAGRRREAEDVLDELLEIARHRYVPPSGIAGLYIRLGDNDNAFAWIEKAYEERANFIAYLAVEPVHDPLRNDPRFASLLARIGLN